MRTLSLILLCLIILAADASAARSYRPGRSDDGPSASSSDRHSSPSSESRSESRNGPPTSYRPSRETRQETPREDPPRSTVREEPKPEPPAPKVDPPKPAEDTSSRSEPRGYRPANPEPEPPKYTPPAPPVTENKPSNPPQPPAVVIKETKPEEAKPAPPATPAPQPIYRPDSSTTGKTPASVSEEQKAPDHTVTRPVVVPDKPVDQKVTIEPRPGPTAATGAKRIDERPNGQVVGTARTQDGTVAVTRRDTSYHPSSSTGNATSYIPHASKPDSATVAGPGSKSSTVNGPGDGAHASGSSTSSPPTGYSPANGPTAPKGYKPNSRPDRTVEAPVIRSKPAYGRTGPADYHPSGYNPRRSDPEHGYRVGYHPSNRDAEPPKGYFPPRLEDGWWHYTTPPIVEDGRWHHPHPLFTRPCRYGHWAYDYYPGFSWRSCYFYFGVYPYVEIGSIYEYPQEDIVFVSDPIYVSGSSYVSESRWDRIDEALGDIRSAWIAGRFDLLKQHVQPQSTIAVLTDGEYDYAVSSDDYLAMTEDALAELQTISFVWNKVRERKDGSVMAFADHAYWSGEGARTVYVSYTLEKIGARYFITEIGSSMKPLN